MNLADMFFYLRVLFGTTDGFFFLHPKKTKMSYDPAVKIQSSARSMRARRDVHYKRVSKKRKQSSVKRFRDRCRFFPHPIDLFGPAGVTFSQDVNYAKAWTDLNFLRWLMPILEKHLPSTEGLYT